MASLTRVRARRSADRLARPSSGVDRPPALVAQLDQPAPGVVRVGPPVDEAPTLEVGDLLGRRLLGRTDDHAAG